MVRYSQGSLSEFYPFERSEKDIIVFFSNKRNLNVLPTPDGSAGWSVSPWDTLP